MNLHAPQSVEAATELREIAAVPLQIVSPRESTPIVSVVQDTLVGANRFTRPNVLFTKKEAMNLLVHAKSWNGKLPEPATSAPQPMWSGQQLLSALLPPVSLQMPNSSYSDADKANPNSQNLVKIINGHITQGILDKSVFSKQLLHIIYNDYGPDITVDFLDSLQAMIAAFLMNSGFSVGISDLIADDDTNAEIAVALSKLTKTIEDQILQLHTGLFENSSGRSNQDEFEGKLMGTLNKAVGDAGKIGLKSLADTNRMTNMIKAGSKGSDVNVSQMVATLGQQAIEGKRVPNGFQHRTLPHFKRFDDSAQARGFIASSYIKGLQPDEFFFHAMSGREGLIDTAVKSVTGDTPIVIQLDGNTKCVNIGDWIDTQLLASKEKVEHFEERQMEYLHLEKPAYIPTTDGEGNVTWGEITAITRHDPGTELYEIKTAAGKKVIVTESKALLIYNDETKLFERMATPDVRPGHYVPVTMNLVAPPIIQSSVQMSNYLSKTTYLYGSDFIEAKAQLDAAMVGRERIPVGWWESHNGKSFVLPYDSKAKLQRATVRSNMDNIHKGYVYPFTTNREHSRIPDTFMMNERNGRFIGLFLAEGNVDVTAGTIQITNNSPAIQSFVKEWFDENGLVHNETTKTNHIGGTTSAVRGYSTVLAKFLDLFVGHGASRKFVPVEAFCAPNDFIVGLLDGYFSGDGTVSHNSIEVGSASKELIDGISMLCTRLGIFGRVFTTQLKSNNLGTETILPTHRISIRAQWAQKFAETIPLIDENKSEKIKELKSSASHRNFTKQNDVVLDEIIEINIIGIEKYPKVYDLTVPSTLNFGLANGLHVVDTADTGYMQRQIRVALEDLITQHDGSVRDAMGNIVQISYGEDGINATKLESQPLPLASMSDEDIRHQFAADGAPNAEQYIQAVLEDRRILVEKVYLNKPQKNVRYPVHLERLLYAIRNGFQLVENEGTVTATEVLDAQNRILSRTHAKNRLWGALIRYHLSPRNLQKIGYTSVALDALVEQIVLKHWKSWVEPGQPVGVIAAQSIGEPATQMSVLYSTKIQIHNKNGSYSGAIGAYIDKLLETQKDKVVTLGKDSVVLDIDDGDAIVGVSTDEKTSWIPISQVSRHPANGGLVEVHTRTGRVTTATLTHSFLKRTPKGVDSVLGSDLKVGDRVPVAVTIPEVATPIRTVTQDMTTFALDKSFGWLCGLYLADGCFQGNKVSISKVNPYVETRLKQLADVFGFRFSIQHKKGAYGPSKDNNIHSKDLRDFLEAYFSHGSFGKAIHGDVFHMPREFIAGLISGYFDGDGNVNVERQQIRLSSRNEQLMRDINRLLGYCGLFGYLGKETSIRMPDAVQYTLNIPKSLIGTFVANIGLELPEKAEALQQILTYKARLDKPDRSQDMLDKIPACGDLIAETGKLLALPAQSRTYGRWAKKESIGRDTLKSYLPKFNEGMKTVKDETILEKVTANIKLLEQAVNSDILWDEIVELKYLDDPKTFVYDFTVPGNDSFMVDDNILVHNTLNSVDWTTEILIAKDGKIQIPKIGEFIDNYLDNCDPAKIQRLPNDQLYVALDDGHEWSAISCDENGEMMWTKLEAVTKHPVVNDDGTDTILEVTTESGRTVKATKGKSFLTLRDGKIVDMNGADLVIGDVLPIAMTLAIHQLTPVGKLDLKTVLSPKEFLFGDEVEKDSFREAFLNGANTRAAEFKPGFVYPKSTRSCSSQIPANIELNREFGYFVGAFVAEGSSSTTQIQITNNDDGFLAPIRKLMDSWSVGHNTVSSEKDIVSSGIKGRSTSLILHSTLLTTAFRAMFGINSHTKTVPDWVLQAPDNFVKGFMDGYMSGDGYVDNRNTIHCSSSSEALIQRLSALLARFQIFTRLSSYEPKIQTFQSVARHYTLTIPPKYSHVFATTFTLSIAHKQERLNAIQAREDPFVCKEKEFNNVILDRVKTIKEVVPKGGRVYDLTVEKTRNFTALNLLCVKDTFHLSGVASKSAMTRGVPRLKELLKATSNPKAIELTIPLRRDLREKKEEARRVAQELEFTLLQDIVTVARIYFDPRDSATLIAEDVDWLSYLSAYESAAVTKPATPQAADPLSSAGDEDDVEMPAEPPKSPWILRFELDKERMFAKNITMDDIAFILKTKFSDNISTLYTDYNSSRLIFRVRLLGPGDGIDDLTTLKVIQNRVLVGTAIRGIPGLRAVNYQKISDQVELKDGKYSAVDQYVLISDGSNFLEVLAHPDVDATRVLSSNVHDMYKNLGIEATRATFFKEITTLFAESGSSVNYRHVCILLDMMCHKGKTMSVDRYGINKNNIGPLAKMSFEQTEDIALRAATFGERDPVLGVSAKVMLGAPIKAGTSFSELLFDEVAAQHLMETTPEQATVAMMGPIGFTEDELDNAMYGGDDEGGACAMNELRMNVAIPVQSDLLVEEVDEDIETTIVE